MVRCGVVSRVVYNASIGVQSPLYSLKTSVQMCDDDCLPTAAPSIAKVVSLEESERSHFGIVI